MGDDQSEDADSNSENDRNDPKKRMEGGLESSVHTPSTGDDSRDDQYGDGYGTMTYGDMN